MFICFNGSFDSKSFDSITMTFQMRFFFMEFQFSFSIYNFELINTFQHLNSKLLFDKIRIWLIFCFCPRSSFSVSYIQVKIFLHCMFTSRIHFLSYLEKSIWRILFTICNITIFFNSSIFSVTVIWMIIFNIIIDFIKNFKYKVLIMFLLWNSLFINVIFSKLFFNY